MAAAACTGQALQRGFDLAEFDAVPADLDAVIGTADELQGAVVPVAGQITGAIPGAAVMLDEALRGQLGTATVTPGDSATGHPQLTGHPIGAVVAAVGHYPAGVVGKRDAVWHRGPVRWQIGRVLDLENGCVDRGFGGSTQPREPCARRLHLQAAGQVGTHPVAADGHRSQRRQPAPADFEQHVQPARHEIQRRDLVSVDKPGPGVGIAALRFVDHHDRSAGAQGGEDVQHRHVALQRRQGKPAICGA